MLSFESKRLFLKELDYLSLLRVLRVLGTGVLDQSMQAELLKSLGNLQELQHLDLYFSVGMDEAALEWDKAVFSKHLRHLDTQGIWLPCVPSFIDPTLLLNLCNLELHVGHMDAASLRALDGLPDLRFLRIVLARYGMVSHKQAAVVTIAAHDVFFHKVRCLLLKGWMVQWATNDQRYDAMVFDSKAKDGGRSRVAPVPVVMPNLD